MNQEQIGKWIAYLRKAKKLTQEQLAERLGVSSRSVSRWENGRCMPDFSLLWDLSGELGVSVPELLNGARAEGKEKAGIEDSINVFLVWSGQEKQRKAKKLKHYFGAGAVSLILALLQAKFGTVSFLFPDGPEDLLTGILAAVGILSEFIGFAYIRQNAFMTQREIELLSKNGGTVRMKNGKEMLQFAQKYRAVDSKCYKAAFAEIEKELKGNESVIFSATGDSYSRNELPMMWYAVLAATETRLLIGGQRLKGLIMVRYEVESFALNDITRVEQSGFSVVIHASGMELKIEEGNPEAAAGIARGLREAAGIK